MKKTFAVVGGDACQQAAARWLKKMGCTVTDAEGVYRADYILLPMPLAADCVGLARLLRALGAKVTVAARRAGARAQAEADGCSAVPMQRLGAAAAEADCIINTVPALVLGRAVLQNAAPETLAAKSLLRSGCPILPAPYTNDGLCGSAAHIGSLLERKNFYFVPLGQDDPVHKPYSLQSDFSLLPDALACALRGRQLQPILN